MRGVHCITFTLGLFVLTGCVSQNAYKELHTKYTDRGAKLATLVKKYEVTMEQNDLLKLNVRAKEVLLKKREEELALVRQTALTIKGNWEDQLAKELEEIKKMGFAVNEKTGGIILEESIFFEKGSANLKSGAKSVLARLAQVLKARAGHIQINGHTDADPVRKHAKTWPYGNIQLSGARAMHVLLFLKNEGGINPTRMSFAGYGPYQPIASNNSEANKRKNRRVEILLSESDAS